MQVNKGKTILGSGMSGYQHLTQSVAFIEFFRVLSLVNTLAVSIHDEQHIEIISIM